MNDKQRAAFEKWYKENINQDGPFLGCREAFRSEHAAISAKAWQAALSSVVVELPTLIIDEYDNGETLEYVEMSELKDSLIKAGIRYE